ncbi:MAG TPA: sigma-70 family RNA polymerase sigma factor [Verrucomicrobiales bacterium]|jgi:RNA polymerase sigma-70 factor (ECF subfamily)|nr:sigma-70 family RNA polymerase sigma factor [Verrucomicrobiales bacterium]
MPPTEATLLNLHAACAEGVYRYLWSLTADEGAAKDLLQEVFVRIARDASGIEAAESSRAWVFKMARNAGLDWLRRRRVRENAVERMAAEAGECFLLPDDPDAKAMQSRMAEALAALPEDQRTAIHLHLWDGLTFREIAEIQGAPLPTVASRYRYGIAALRGLLQPLYSELYECT